METAGQRDVASMPDSVGLSDNEELVKIGIGTPATRAATIETLIQRGYVVRDKKNILVTEKGANLVRIVPESVKSAKLTAEWETILHKIARGEHSADDFMAAITDFVKKLVAENSAVSSGNAGMFAPVRESIGKCPKCGGDVTENSKSYSCGSRCGFVIWKSIAQKTITIVQAKKLLEKGKTDKIKGFKNKAGSEFAAVLCIKKDFSVGFEF
jgi:DNA topoisomerase-3